MNDTCGCGNHGGTRRDLLRWSAAAAGFAALGPFRGVLPTASGSPQNLKRLVIVNMFGGCDTLNMLIPHTLQPYYDRRPGIAILPQDGLSLGGPAPAPLYKLHPAMPRIAALWYEGKVAAVNRVGYPDENLSHFTSMDIFSYGVRNSFGPLGIPPSGWLARYADRNAATPMGAVGLGVGRPLDFEGGLTPAFLANDLPNFRIYNFNSPAELHRLQKAKEILANFQGTGQSTDAKVSQSLAYDLADQVQTALTGYVSPVTYGNSYIARRLREVAVLIKGGFETRIFYTGFGGFDTHGAQGTGTGAQANLFGAMDDGIGSLVDDLKDMGIWEDTMIVVLTEFGRRNYENGSVGTDHGHGFTELILGGAVKGGMYGPDLVAADINLEHLTYAVDFRSIYKEILADHLSADPEPIFPEALQKNVVVDFA